MLTDGFTTTRPRRARGDGSIYQSSDGTWQASLSLGCDSDGRRARRHVQAPSRPQVMAKLDLLQMREGPGWTVGQWTQMWLALVERTLKTSTARAYRTYIRYLGPVAEVAMGDLTAEHIESIYDGLASRGVSPETIHSVHRTVRSCLGEAVRRGVIIRNPASVARPHRSLGVEIHPLSVDEVRQVLAVASRRRKGAR